MYIGIDLGGTNIAAGLVNDAGEILYKDKVKTNPDRHYSEIVRDMAELSKEVAHSGGVSLDKIKWVGVGSPGTCDCERGVLIFTNNINFYNTPMKEEFVKHFDLPFYLENDANCAALGEALLGGGRGTKNSVTITIGTGIGSGIIIDGKIMTGFNHAGGELGHTIIVADGEKCSCGNNGCWEAYASATALIRQTKAAMERDKSSLMWELARVKETSARTAFEAAHAGDAAAAHVVEKYIYYLSVGILNVVNIFQPEKLLIGGGVSGEGEYILEPIRKFIKERDYYKGENKAKIEKAQLGNDAGIIGAAMLGMQN